MSRPTLEPLPLAALRAGDPDALRLVYQRHATEILALLYRLTASRTDAEDLLHDLFVGLPEAVAHY